MCKVSNVFISLSQLFRRALYAYCTLALLLATGIVYAKKIDVAAGWSRPPYIIPESHSGFELDLVKQVLASMGHQANFIYLPFTRTISLLKQGKVDMALTLDANSGVDKSQLGDVFVVYQNVVLSLRENKLQINNIADLGEVSLVAFQGASIILGREFLEVTSGNKLYVEIADQRRQLELLLQGEVDAIIADINIFTALSKSLTGTEQTDKVAIHPLFPVNRYSAGFKQIELKHAFNQALRQYVAQGHYQKLTQRYNLQKVTPLSDKK